MSKTYQTKVVWSGRHSASTNGRAERLGRVILSDIKTQLFSSDLQLRFWAESCIQAEYVRNNLSKSSNKGAISPFEAVFGKVPSYEAMYPYVCPFGRTGWVSFSKSTRKEHDGGKHAQNGIECRFLHRSICVKGCNRVLISGRQYDVPAHLTSFNRNRPKHLLYRSRKLKTDSEGKVRQVLNPDPSIYSQSCPTDEK